MKRSKYFVLSLIFLIPFFTFLGCSSPVTYTISAQVSCGNGNVSGMGTYAEGESVTLIAQSYGTNTFIAWVYQNKKVLLNDDTYTIVNQKSDDKITKSSLTFQASNLTADKYTAVFSDNRQLYYTLSDYAIQNLADNSDAMLEGKLTVQFGEDLNNFQNAYSDTFVNGEKKETNSPSVMFLSKDFYLKINIDISENNFQKIIPIKFETGYADSNSTVTFMSNNYVVSYSFELQDVFYNLILNIDSLNNYSYNF